MESTKLTGETRRPSPRCLDPPTHPPRLPCSRSSRQHVPKGHPTPQDTAPQVGGEIRANTSPTGSGDHPGPTMLPLRPTICLCGLLSGRALACRAFSMSSAVRPPTGDWSWWKNLRWMPLAKNKSLRSTKSLPLTLPIGEVACPESPASLKGPPET